MGTPLVAALLAIPPLISGLGLDRFGALTLIWALVSYAGLLDLGIGRALILRLSEVLQTPDEVHVPAITASALATLAVLGAAGAVAIGVSAPFLSSAWFGGGAEGVNAAIAAAAAVPLVLVSSGLRGVLEARREFAVVNLVRVPLGIATFVAPLVAISVLGPRLDVAAWSLTVVRLVAILPMAMPTFRDRWWQAPPRLDVVVSLLRTGGWLSLAAVVAPLMNYVDRFIVAGAVSTAAVALYVTPQEMITKLWIIPGAVTAVLFPTFAASAAAGKWGPVRSIYGKSVLAISAITAPVCIAVSIFAYPLLEMWIGTEFARGSATVLQLLSVGVFFSCIAHVPFTLLQSSGRARLTAFVSLVQLPIYLTAVWWAVREFGIEGVAWVWMARSALDAAILFLFAASALASSNHQAKE